MKLKLIKPFVVLFSVLSLFLHSCSDDDSQNLTVEKEIKYQKISLREIKSKAGKSKSFSKVLQAVDDFKKKNSTNSRELDMNDYYVDENNGSYIESDGTQTYTFPVYDLTTESENIENLVITLDIEGEYSYAIVEYGLTQDQFNPNLTSAQATPISITSRVTVEVCKILMCYNHGNGTAGVSHIAGANCVNPAFLFYVYVYYSPNSGSGGTGGTGTGNTTGGTGTGTGDNTGGTGTGTGTGSNTTGGGGVVTTPVVGTLSQKQLSFLRELGFSGESFMGMDYSAIVPVLNYINGATNQQVNTVLYFFKNQMSYLWMGDQSAQNQASICNYLIANNFSLNSINNLNQLINIATSHGASFTFDSNLNSSNSLSLNSINDLSNHINNNEVIYNSGAETLELPSQNNDYVGRYRIKATGLGGIMAAIRFSRVNNLYQTDKTRVESALYGFNPFTNWIPFSNNTTLVENIANGQVKIQIYGNIQQQYTIPGFDGIIFNQYVRIIIIVDRETGALESAECIFD